MLEIYPYFKEFYNKWNKVIDNTYFFSFVQNIGFPNCVGLLYDQQINYKLNNKDIKLSDKSDIKAAIVNMINNGNVSDVTLLDVFEQLTRDIIKPNVVNVFNNTTEYRIS